MKQNLQKGCPGGFLKIASGCTARSYDLQKGCPLKCSVRLDKNFWRGIIDLRDRLRRRVFLGQAAYRPSSQGSKAANDKNTREGRARGRLEPVEWRGNLGRPRTRGKTQDPGSGAGTGGVAREPGEDLDPHGPPGGRSGARGSWVGPTSLHG